MMGEDRKKKEENWHKGNELQERGEDEREEKIELRRVEGEHQEKEEIR